MKMPAAKDWLSILAALAALIIAAYAALKDGNITDEEAADIKEKAGSLIDTVHQATQEPQEAPTEAAP